MMIQYLRLPDKCIKKFKSVKAFKRSSSYNVFNKILQAGLIEFKDDTVSTETITKAIDQSLDLTKKINAKESTL